MKGVLIGNLGTPLKPTVREVRRYLSKFPMDPLVIDIPFIYRWLLVNLIIIPFRVVKSTKAYKSVWMPEGSPLLHYSSKQKEALASCLDYPVALGMNYGEPSILKGIKELIQQGVDEIICLPLYPHYALSSFESLVQKIKKVSKNLKPYLNIKLKIIPPFYKNQHYISALSHVIQTNLPKEYDHILFSYHGIPERHILKADEAGFCQLNQTCCEKESDSHQTCYRAQVIQTTLLTVRQLKIPENKYSISFQSRLGREPWLRPFTDVVIPEFARKSQKKIKHLVVVCPSFTSDCLETLEEIGIRARESFLEYGGKDLILIPCLNENSLWTKAMQNIIEG